MRRPRSRTQGIFASLVVSSLVLGGVVVVGVAGPASAASSPPSQGVTATTIRVGIPYVDLSSVRKFGITLDQGSFPDAYNALISNLNAHGGIDGRHLVPYLVAVNPVGTAPAITACTQLAQDDEVFVAIAPQQPDCYLQQYHVPTIAGSFQNVQSGGASQLHPGTAARGLRPAATGGLRAPRRVQGEGGRSVCRDPRRTGVSCTSSNPH